MPVDFCPACGDSLIEGKPYCSSCGEGVPSVGPAGSGEQEPSIALGEQLTHEESPRRGQFDEAGQQYESLRATYEAWQSAGQEAPDSYFALGDVDERGSAFFTQLADFMRRMPPAKGPELEKALRSMLGDDFPEAASDKRFETAIARLRTSSEAGASLAEEESRGMLRALVEQVFSVPGEGDGRGYAIAARICVGIMVLFTVLYLPGKAAGLSLNILGGVLLNPIAWAALVLGGMAQSRSARHRGEFWIAALFLVAATLIAMVLVEAGMEFAI